MTIGELGKIFHEGEEVVRAGEQGDCLYVVQAGQLEVIGQSDKGEVRLGTLGPGDICGEMALFDKSPRSATVRAVGEARVLSVDRKGFLRRVHQDPSLAYRILQSLSQRVRDLNDEVIRLRGLRP